MSAEMESEEPMEVELDTSVDTGKSPELGSSVSCKNQVSKETESEEVVAPVPVVGEDKNSESKELLGVEASIEDSVQNACDNASKSGTKAAEEMIVTASLGDGDQSEIIVKNDSCSVGTETEVRCDDPVVSAMTEKVVEGSSEDGNNDSGDLAVTAEEENAKNKSLIYFLASQTVTKCEEVEAAALDYVATGLHHPVISCFREITKADFDVIFNQKKFQTEANELEQGITCITLMDYIAMSLGNPLYSDNFSKKECSIRPRVKKIFMELRRILREWAEKDPLNFIPGKRMILKYLDGLTPYFRTIQFDKAYASALKLLEKDAARALRNCKPKHSQPRPVLNEVVENSPNPNESSEKDTSIEEIDPKLSGECFDFLDGVPCKPSKPVSIFTKNPTKKSKTTPLLQKIKSTTDSPINTNTSITEGKSTEKKSAVKRPSTFDIGNSIKKFCFATAGKSSNSLSNSNSTSIARESVPVSSNDNSSKDPSPPKEKVNAFVFLMNRSKELAKASKIKKQTANTKSPATTAAKATPPPAIQTID